MGFNQNQLATDLQETFESQPPDAETAAALMAGNIVSNYTDSGGGTEWTNLPLSTGFSPPSTARTPMYRLNGQNVELKGVVYRTTSTGLVFATLPEGFRPSYTMYFPMCEITNSQTLVSVIQINSNGYMYAGSTSSQYIHLAGVCFPTV